MCCSLQDILQHNYDLKLGNADYKGMSADQALSPGVERCSNLAYVFANNQLVNFGGKFKTKCKDKLGAGARTAPCGFAVVSTPSVL